MAGTDAEPLHEFCSPVFFRKIDRFQQERGAGSGKKQPYRLQLAHTWASVRRAIAIPHPLYQQKNRLYLIYIGSKFGQAAACATLERQVSGPLSEEVFCETDNFIFDHDPGVCPGAGS